MITKDEYVKALKVVEDFRQQELAKQSKVRKVRLSAWGVEMQGNRRKNLVGVIVNKMLAGMDDYCVEVLWDNGKIEWMHESQVKFINT